MSEHQEGAMESVKSAVSEYVAHQLRWAAGREPRNHQYATDLNAAYRETEQRIAALEGALSAYGERDQFGVWHEFGCTGDMEGPTIMKSRCSVTRSLLRPTALTAVE